mmetsp:Transcript_12078/g.26902  ORF Transcript_12078/g.26902 Transcript_12078/m.26902 type:complete len:211 (+) Transcript_12078:1198-1830(+)
MRSVDVSSCASRLPKMTTIMLPPRMAAVAPSTLAVTGSLCTHQPKITLDTNCTLSREAIRDCAPNAKEAKLTRFPMTNVRRPMKHQEYRPGFASHSFSHDDVSGDPMSPVLRFAPDSKSACDNDSLSRVSPRSRVAASAFFLSASSWRHLCPRLTRLFPRLFPIDPVVPSTTPRTQACTISYFGICCRSEGSSRVSPGDAGRAGSECSAS